MKFGLFFTLAAGLVAALQSEEAKIEDAYKPCGCNQIRCPAALAEVAARLIINDYCGAISNKSLISLQGGFATCDATFSSNYFNPDLGVSGQCTNSGPLPIFTQLLASAAVNCVSMTVDSVHVTAKGQIIAYSTLVSNIGTSPNQTTSSMRWVFNPDEACPCKFYVHELSLVSAQCQ